MYEMYNWRFQGHYNLKIFHTMFSFVSSINIYLSVWIIWNQFFWNKDFISLIGYSCQVTYIYASFLKKATVCIYRCALCSLSIAQFIIKDVWYKKLKFFWFSLEISIWPRILSMDYSFLFWDTDLWLISPRHESDPFLYTNQNGSQFDTDPELAQWHSWSILKTDFTDKYHCRAIKTLNVLEISIRCLSPENRDERETDTGSSIYPSLGIKFFLWIIYPFYWS